MKTKILLAILLLISVSCFGKHIYTIPKADFINQFSNPKSLSRVYCFNEEGNKVWFMTTKNTLLTLKLKDNNEKVLILHTVKYDSETIEAIEFNTWSLSMLPKKKTSIFNIGDVESFTMERRFNDHEYEMPFFNLDSIRNVVRSKNDSLRKEYAAGTEWVICLTAKEKPDGDTLAIRSNASYHINFKDNNRVEYGVVKKITQDSIYISSSFNKAMAASSKKEYTIYQYPINDISGLRLLKSDHYSAREIKLEDYNIIIKKIDKVILGNPCWYAADPLRGEIKFYRFWRTDRGFSGITEIDGKAIWYEGGITH